jgi:O-antigen/teichoic acid export membrane protein
MSWRKAVPAGLVDVGLASLATFGGGLVAARYLPLEGLGAYAVYFRVFALVTVVSAQLVFRPARIEALVNPRAERVQVLSRSLRRGAPVAALASLVTLVTAFIVGGDTATSVLVALSITTPIAAFLSPLQDQVRRVFHLAGQSWKAAAVSAVQAFTVFAVIGILLAFDVNPAWMPFGSLAIANAASLSVGLVIAGLHRGPLGGDYGLRHLARSGKWFLTSALLPAGTAVIVAVLIARLAGNVALGQAEAARIVSQPVLVFSLGLAAVVNPRAMEAAKGRFRAKAKTLSRSFDGAVALAAVLMLLLAGFDFPWNVLADLVPNAYVVTGLAAVAIIANAINASVKPEQAQLGAAGRERRIVGAELKASGTRLLVALSAGVTQAFALALSLGIGGIVRIIALKHEVTKIYAGAGTQSSAAEGDRPALVSPTAMDERTAPGLPYAGCRRQGRGTVRDWRAVHGNNQP